MGTSSLFLVLLTCVFTLNNAIVYPGRPVTVLDFANSNATTPFTYNSVELNQILNHPEVTGRKISLVSIAGAFRKGKSFLMDHFLRYMYTNYKSVGSPTKPLRQDQYETWLGDKYEPLVGFSFKSGSKRHTSGMILWSDVFLYDATNGEKIAIILMDTQGLFDSQSLPADNARIFSLSTLISSVEIFNLNGHIHENELEYLEFATEFAKLAVNSKIKPFQNLMFLVRDWNVPEDHQYGLNGGESILNEVMKSSYSQKPELADLRSNIDASFDSISCFLMPYPGETVATKKDYNGNWGSVNEVFLDQLQDLVSILLSPQNLVTKNINGKAVNGNEFLIYINSYIELYQSDKLPVPQSLYEATINNQMKILISEFFAAYQKIVYKSFDGLKEYSEIEPLHEGAKELVSFMFDGEDKMGTPAHISKYRNELMDKIEENFEIWRLHADQHIKNKIDIVDFEKKLDKPVLLRVAANKKVVGVFIIGDEGFIKVVGALIIIVGVLIIANGGSITEKIATFADSFCSAIEGAAAGYHRILATLNSVKDRMSLFGYMQIQEGTAD